MLTAEQSQTLVTWNRVMALFHATFVVLTAATANLDMQLPLFRPQLAAPTGNATDGFSSWVTPSALVPDDHVLYITWVALAFSALSAAFHFLNAQVWRQWYLDGIGLASCPSRWIEYSISAPLQGVAIAYLTGVTQTETIVAIFGLISTTMFFGHLTEVVARPVDEFKWTKPALERLTPHFLGYVPFVIAIAIILQVFLRGASASYEDEATGEEIRMPSFVYAIVASQIALFSSFTVVQLAVTLRAPKDYVYGELAYMVLSLAAKGVLSFLLLTNVIALEIFGSSE